MDLVALKCKSCGANLDFDGSFRCECPNCKTKHALFESGGVYLLGSYAPYTQNGNGKMQKSLKLQLAEKIRNETDGVFSVCNSFFGEYHITIIKGKLFYSGSIIDNEHSITIGVNQVNEKVRKVGFLWNRQETHFTGDIAEAMKLFVIPVKAENDVLIGHRVLIEVDGLWAEDYANKLSLLVQEWFDTVPEVTLARG